MSMLECGAAAVPALTNEHMDSLPNFDEGENFYAPSMMKERISVGPNESLSSASSDDAGSMSLDENMVDIAMVADLSRLDTNLDNNLNVSDKETLQAKDSASEGGSEEKGLNDDEDKEDDVKAEVKQDPDDKPGLSYIALISMAIQSSPKKKMLLGEIYQWITEKYPFYQERDRSWRNSIRHNLSLNECFIKSGRSENGKGNYWSIHAANMEDFAKGDYRRRRARRRVRMCNETMDRIHGANGVRSRGHRGSISNCYIPMTVMSAHINVLIDMFGEFAILTADEILQRHSQSTMAMATPSYYGNQQADIYNNFYNQGQWGYNQDVGSIMETAVNQCMFSDSSLLTLANSIPDIPWQ